MVGQFRNATMLENLWVVLVHNYFSAVQKLLKAVCNYI